jgi:1,4-dihydroxy-2-naphthoyl-CoA synthase
VHRNFIIGGGNEQRGLKGSCRSRSRLSRRDLAALTCRMYGRIIPKPITAIVAFSPGGGTDIAARVI